MIQYRGYSIDELINNGKKFIDVSHLLVWGHLPTALEAENFQANIFSAMTLDDSVYTVIRSFPSVPSDPLTSGISNSDHRTAPAVRP